MARDPGSVSTSDSLSDLSPLALREALQQLRVHQIELEAQNDELRRTQSELNTAEARYFDFYDLAPVGYVTVNDKARILQANLTAAKLLGVPRADLIGEPLPRFMPATDADRYYLLCRQALATPRAQSCELRMQQSNADVVWVCLHAIAVPGDAGTAVIRMVLSDITARKQLEERMVQREADTKAIIDGASDAIFITDSTGRYQYVNQQATQLLGFGRNELLGMGFSDITPDDDLAAMRVRFQQLLDTGVLRFEALLKHSNGSTVAVELNCRMLADGRLFGACRDISARKEVETQRLSNNKFRDAILDSVPAQIAVLDQTGNIVAVNQRWRDFALDNSPIPGQPPSHTAIGTNYLDICQATSGSDTDGSATLARNGILQVMDGSAPSFQLEYPSHSPTQQRWFSLAVTRLNLDKQAVVVTHTDITQRRQLEQAAKEASEDKFRLVADNTSDGILIVGADRQVEYVSPAFLKQLGYSQAEQLGRTSEMVIALIHPQERDAVVQRIECAIESKESELLYANRVRHQRGHYIWRENNAKFQYDGLGNFTGVYIVARDITERKRAEAEMQEMNLNLIQSRQQLRNLVTLNETTLEKEKRHIAREVHDELGQILTALRMDLSLAIIRHADHIPDLLAALNSMKMHVDRAVEGVRNVATSLRPAALDMGLVTALEWLCLEFTKHGAVECALHGFDEGIAIDDDRAVVIFRIVQEALTNIRKYAQASQVDITLERRAAELSIEVRDNGLGFDLVAVAQRGTLGLLGMRERVIALGGRFEVVSTPGQGTVIALLIPLAPEVAKAPA